MEEGETLDQAVIREVKEETGYDITVTRFHSLRENFFRRTMTRKLFSLFVAMLALIMLAACSHAQTKPLTQKSVHGELPSKSTLPELTLEMVTDQTEYPSSTKEIAFEIKNEGPATVNFGTPYYVEKREQGTWYEIPFKDNVAFTEIGLMLAAGEGYQGKINLTDLDYSLTTGDYRMIKRFHSNEKEIFLAVVFQVK